MSGRILITGGLGAIGSFVTRRFVEEGLRPLVLDARPDFALVRDLNNRFDFITGDVLDLPGLMRLVKEREIGRIVHLAAVMPPAAQENPPLGWQVNTWGTLHVLEAARTFKVERVVFASSKAVLGAMTGEHGHPIYRPVSEAHPYNPTSVYGATKVAGELMGRQYMASYGIEFVALRFAATYGPGKLARHGAVGTTSRLIETVLAGKEFSLPQGADQRDDLVYNRDVGGAVFLAATVPTLSAHVFHIGTGRLSSLGEVAEALREICPDVRVKIGPGLDYYGAGQFGYCLFDISKAREVLGFNPRYDIGKGVRDYIELLRALGLPAGAS
jgi:UDP-glucose 4-epimerase